MTSRIRQWSPNAASNNQTPPNGAPEGGTLINQLSDILRQIMAEVRAWWEVPGWIDYGHTPTYSSGTVFTVTGNQTGIYEVGRRVRATNASLAIIYGTITASVYTVTTAVTVAWDSSTLDSTLAEVAIGASSVSGSWINIAGIKGLGSLAAKSSVVEADIVNSAVTTAKINDGAVTFIKVAAAAVAAAADITAGTASKLATATSVKTYVEALITSWSGFSKPVYTSPDFDPPPVVGTTSFAHGLATTPKDVQCYAKCMAAIEGYSVGDIIRMDCGTAVQNSFQYGQNVWANQTNVGVSLANSGGQIISRTSGTLIALYGPGAFKMFLVAKA